MVSKLPAGLPSSASADQKVFSSLYLQGAGIFHDKLLESRMNESYNIVIIQISEVPENESVDRSG